MMVEEPESNELFADVGKAAEQKAVKDLAPAVSPLIGFNSLPEWPVGKIILPVRAGSMTKQVEFWVLKVPSTYNIILGRTWLPAMRSVAPTYTQVMRFPNEGG